LVEDGEEFVLAEVTAIAGVGAVGGVFHFVSFDEFVTDGELEEEYEKLIAVVGGVAGRDGGDGESAIAEGAVCGPGEIGGVCAAGEGDDEGGKFCKIREKLGFLLIEGKRRRIVETDLNDRAHGMREV